MLTWMVIQMDAIGHFALAWVKREKEVDQCD